MGALKGKSPASLAAGVVLAVPFAAAGYMLQTGEETVDFERGHRVGVYTSTALTALMGSRAFRTRKPVPAVLAVVGVAGLGYHFTKWNEWNESLAEEVASEQHAAELDELVKELAPSVEVPTKSGST